MTNTSNKTFSADTKKNMNDLTRLTTQQSTNIPNRTIPNGKSEENASTTNIPQLNMPRKTNGVTENSKEWQSSSHNDYKSAEELFQTTLSPISKDSNKTPNMSKNSKEDIETNKISVAVRIRPISEREISLNGNENTISISNNTLCVSKTKPRKKEERFDVDYIFQSFNINDPTYCSQEKLYRCLGVPLLVSAMKGYNVCLLAYGQTGSGKSFSMMGKNGEELDCDEHSGIIPRFCRDLIARIENLQGDISVNLKISYFEVYNEKIYDLLVEEFSNRNTLKVRDNPTYGVYIENLSTKNVKTYDEVQSWLKMGNRNRIVSATNMNEQSSRSHGVFKVELNFSKGSDDEENTSCSVCLVDLAGNERQPNDFSIRKKNLRESSTINKSLSTLAHVISCLASKRDHIPYRDSVLTTVLKESISGNSLTTMLFTISPSILYVEETISTLNYATTAKLVEKSVQINEKYPQNKIIQKLKLEIKALQHKLNENEKINSEKYQKHIENKHQARQLKDLQTKLNETERKLENIMTHVENLDEELESKKRILSNPPEIIQSTTRKSTLIDNLENILKENVSPNLNKLCGSLMTWCKENNVICYTNPHCEIILTNLKHRKQTSVEITHLNSMMEKKSIDQIMRCLIWHDTKSENPHQQNIINSMNTLYESLTFILPPRENKKLDVLYTSISKSLQEYENLLFNLIENKTL